MFSFASASSASSFEKDFSGDRSDDHQSFANKTFSSSSSHDFFCRVVLQKQKKKKISNQSSSRNYHDDDKNSTIIIDISSPTTIHNFIQDRLLPSRTEDNSDENSNDIDTIPFFPVSLSGIKENLSSSSFPGTLQTASLPLSGSCFIMNETISSLMTLLNNTSSNLNCESNNSHYSSSLSLSFFGMIVHNVSCLRKKNNIKNNNDDEAIFTISFTPMCLRLKQFDEVYQLPSSQNTNSSSLHQEQNNSSLFVALSETAYEEGIGDVLYDESIYYNNTDRNHHHQQQASAPFFFRILNGLVSSFSSTTTTIATLLPSLDKINILAIGLDFPEINIETQTVRSFAQTKTTCSNENKSSDDENEKEKEKYHRAKRHLQNLREWANNIVRNGNAENRNPLLPDWMIPSEPSQVQYWCSVQYLTRNFMEHRNKNNNNNNDDQDEHEDETDERRELTLKEMCHFLVPSSMIWLNTDVRLGNGIPPQCRQFIQEDLSFYFLNRLQSQNEQQQQDNPIQFEFCSDEEVCRCKNDTNANTTANKNSMIFMEKASSDTIKEQNEKLFNNTTTSIDDDNYGGDGKENQKQQTDDDEKDSSKKNTSSSAKTASAVTLKKKESGQRRSRKGE